MKSQISQSIQESIRVKQALLNGHLGEIEKAVNLVVQCLKGARKLIFFGNGGSASDSQHLAAEFVGRYEKERRGLAAIALTTDTSILTAIGNDYSFEQIFARQIEAIGCPGDVAFGISTSGRSKNVILGLKKARALGLSTVGLSGGSGGELKDLVDVPILVPSQKTSRIQECHILIGHIICELADQHFS